MKKIVPGLYFCLILCAFPGTIKAQWPQCDLYRCSFDQSTGKFSAPLLINGFHIKGYNNQPSFSNDGQLYITSNFGTEKTDIFCLNFKSKEFYAFTHTEKISEFSPMIMPDKKHLSVVRIEEDGKSQTLWAYPLDRTSYGKNLLPALDNIGYYSWVDSQWVALFLVDSVPSLALADIKTGKTTLIQYQIGRCLKSLQGQVFFTQRDEKGIHTIKKYNINSQNIETVFALPQGCEDYEVLLNGDIIYSANGEIIRLTFLPSLREETILDLKKYGINNVKRIAFSENEIIVVNQL